MFDRLIPDTALTDRNKAVSWISGYLLLAYSNNLTQTELSPPPSILCITTKFEAKKRNLTPAKSVSKKCFKNKCLFESLFFSTFPQMAPFSGKVTLTLIATYRGKVSWTSSLVNHNMRTSYANLGLPYKEGGHP